MAIAKWIHRYERKPGRWVFEPTDEARTIGIEVKTRVSACWQAPSYYFHLRAGGHVAALREHRDSSFFLKIDIADFFGSVSRSRLARVLKEYFSHREARRLATESTVRSPENPDRVMLPYGFVQSPLLASLALHKSRFGALLDALSKERDLVVTVYMDDIVISGNDLPRLEQILQEVKVTANRSRFQLNQEKEQGPASAISVFNIDLVAGTDMAVTAERLTEFTKVLTMPKNEYQVAGINSYVQSVNVDQVAILADAVEKMVVL